jgi:hypothetical protein
MLAGAPENIPELEGEALNINSDSGRWQRWLAETRGYYDDVACRTELTSLLLIVGARVLGRLLERGISSKLIGFVDRGVVVGGVGGVWLVRPLLVPGANTNQCRFQPTAPRHSSPPTEKPKTLKP